MTVNVPSATYGWADLAVSVDGVQTDLGGDGEIPNVGGSGSTVSFCLYADEFANGSHVISVQDNAGNADQRVVTFNSPISNITYDPIFDTVNSDGMGAPTSMHITGSLASTQPWTVAIQTTDGSQTTVRSYSGTSNTVDVTWDGNDASGNEVADDVYYVVLNVTVGPPHQKFVTKHKTGDVFLLFDYSSTFFPGDMRRNFVAYKNYILGQLKPSVGQYISEPKIIAVNTKALLNFKDPTNVATLNAIHAQFARPLRVFYVDAHGQTSKNGHPLFGLGPFTWNAKIDPIEDTSRLGRVKAAFDMRQEVASASYGWGGQPPAIAWIDSCQSAGGAGGDPAWLANYEFADAFGINYYSGFFMGWNGNCQAYGAYATPNNDWTVWRQLVWRNFVNPNVNCQTEFNATCTQYNAQFYNSIFGFYGTPLYRACWAGNGWAIWGNW